MPFDFIDPNPVHLTGTISTTVLDPDQNPNTVFERTSPWQIRVDWSMHGSIVAAIGGEWTLSAFLESMGPGPEGQVGVPQAPHPVPITSVPLAGAFPNQSRTYSHLIDVPAGVPAADGVYKLVVLVQHSNAGIRDRMAGFAEGPYVEFYTP